MTQRPTRAASNGGAPDFQPGSSLTLSYIPMLFHPVSALLIFPIDFLSTYVLRQLPGARYPFNDLKNKKQYRGFHEQDKEVYNRVWRPADLGSAVGS